MLKKKLLNFKFKKKNIFKKYKKGKGLLNIFNFEMKSVEKYIFLNDDEKGKNKTKKYFSSKFYVKKWRLLQKTNCKKIKRNKTRKKN